MADRKSTLVEKFRAYLLAGVCMFVVIDYLTTPAPPPEVDLQDLIFGDHPVVINPNSVPPYLEPPPCIAPQCREI